MFVVVCSGFSFCFFSSRRRHTSGALVTGVHTCALPIYRVSWEDGFSRHGLAPANYVVISVEDTGTGMDEAQLERAVEPFYSTKAVGKGTGLGLSMAHGLAAQSGGALTLESVVGIGTVASIWLPEAEAAKQAVKVHERNVEIGRAHV